MTFDIITWNVYEGNKRDAVHAALNTMITDHNPHIIALQECTFQGPIQVPGYTTLHAELDHPRHRMRGEDADTAVLVRRDLIIHSHRFHRMREPFHGPHGREHEGRRYWTLRVEFEDIVWKIGAGHWPFGDKPVIETERFVTRFLTRTLPKRPVIFVGDLNKSRRDLQPLLKAANARSMGHGVDLALYRQCRVPGYTVLDHYKSDHCAVLFNFVV